MKKLSTFSFAFICFSILTHSISAQFGGFGGRNGRGGGGMSQNIPQPEQKFSPPDPEKVADEETKWMKKYLKITDEQMPHIEDLNLKYASIRSDYYAMLGDKPDNEKMAMISPRISKSYEDKEKELKGMITPEQWDLYQKELLKKKKR